MRQNKLVGIPISTLPPADPLDGSEIVPLVKAGTNKRATISQILTASAIHAFPATLSWSFDGGRQALVAGVAGYLTVPFDCTITGITMLADQAGSIVVDIWQCPENQFDAGASHPVLADSIVGSDPPTISGGVSYRDVNLVGWGNTALVGGNVLAFVITSTSGTIVKCNLTISVFRSL